jgi:beta-fructofuranosidase
MTARRHQTLSCGEVLWDLFPDGTRPYFWPLGDRNLMPHFSHLSGSKYLLDDYDTQKNMFVVTNGGNFNHGPVSPSGVHAPSTTPEDQGGVIAIFNMN